MGNGLGLPALARAGVTLAGRPVAVDGERISFDAGVPANLAAGEAFAERVRGTGDETIQRRGLDAPPSLPDDGAAPVDLDPPMELDLHGFPGDAATVADAVRAHLGD
jgi:putative flavoprotein involved in K+ transport